MTYQLRFDPRFLHDILIGLKTQTCRPVKIKNDLASAVSISKGNGVTVEAIESDTGFWMCDLFILRLDCVKFDDLTDAQIIADGFETRSEFVAAWDEFYGGTEFSSDKKPDLWVYSFCVV